MQRQEKNLIEIVQNLCEEHLGLSSNNFKVVPVYGDLEVVLEDTAPSAAEEFVKKQFDKFDTALKAQTDYAYKINEYKLTTHKSAVGNVKISYFTITTNSD